MLKNAIKPLIQATVQKMLYNNKVVFSTRNNKSSFVYRKLFLKVAAKDMTVYRNSRLTWEL